MKRNTVLTTTMIAGCLAWATHARAETPSAKMLAYTCAVKWTP